MATEQTPATSQAGHALDWAEVTIEIPRGSRNKYEFDHDRGMYRLDRVLYSSVHYPTDYGIVQETLSGDGDPIDVLVVVEEPTFSGCHLRARPIGTLTMVDEHDTDEKIFAVLWTIRVLPPSTTWVTCQRTGSRRSRPSSAAIKNCRALRPTCAAGPVRRTHGISSRRPECAFSSRRQRMTRGRCDAASSPGVHQRSW